MLNFIKNIPNQPYHIRIQIFWVAVVVSILLIGWIWLGLLKKTVSVNINKPVLTQNQNSQNSSGSSDFSLFRDLKNTFNSLSAEIGSFFKKDNSDKKETYNPGANQEQHYQKPREVLKLPSH